MTKPSSFLLIDRSALPSILTDVSRGLEYVCYTCFTFPMQMRDKI